jgi:histidyl-tRNA synthetase
VRFGSVGGGGRYDGLVKRFTGQDVPATGFSIGVSRLMTALKNLGKLDDAGTIAGSRRGAGHGSRHERSAATRRWSPACARPASAPNVSRLVRHEGADEICRPARRALRHHPGR